jgi:hypothetical protein
MLQLKPLDQNVPIFQQLSADASPVVLVNATSLKFGSPRQAIPPAYGKRL